MSLDKCDGAFRQLKAKLETDASQAERGQLTMET